MTNQQFEGQFERQAIQGKVISVNLNTNVWSTGILYSVNGAQYIEASWNEPGNEFRFLKMSEFKSKYPNAVIQR
jgi:hypothetical protein